MKKILSLTLCAVLALGMTACEQRAESSADSSAETTAESRPEIPEGAIADASGTFIYTGMLTQGGDAENGYVQIPLGYIPFQEEGVDGLTQYCDPSGTNIITLDRYNDVDYMNAATSMRFYYEEMENAEGLSGSITTVNGYNALQLCCHFTDDDKFLFTWLIEDPSNPASCYYLSMEFANEDSAIVACSSTFQTAADYVENAVE